MQVDQVRRRPYILPVLRFALRRALRRQSPDMIPMGPMERLAGRDYSTVYIDGISLSKGKYWLVDGIDEDEVKLRECDGTSEPVPGTSQLNDLRRSNFRVIVYFRHLEWRFFSLYRYALFSIFGMVRARVAFDNLLQWITNRASLPTIERTKALRVAVKRAFDGEHELDMSNVMPIAGRQHRHPGLLKAHSRHDFILKSLVETGELKSKDAYGVYEITPKALVTLDQYDREERKLKAQGRAALWTALLAAIVGGIVSGIISLT